MLNIERFKKEGDSQSLCITDSEKRGSIIV